MRSTGVPRRILLESPRLPAARISWGSRLFVSEGTCILGLPEQIAQASCQYCLESRDGILEMVAELGEEKFGKGMQCSQRD